jgi:hypothetical protein
MNPMLRAPKASVEETIIRFHYPATIQSAKKTVGRPVLEHRSDRIAVVLPTRLG